MGREKSRDPQEVEAAERGLTRIAPGVLLGAQVLDGLWGWVGVLKK
jgi:hypothetical protein